MRRMRSLSVFLGVLLLSCGSVLAQNTVIMVNFFGGSTNGSSCGQRTNTVDVTLKDMSNNVIATATATGTQMYSGQYVGYSSYQLHSANPLPYGWQGKISAYGRYSGTSCSSESATIAETIITFSATGCNNYSLRAGQTSTYEVTLGVSIYAPIGNVAFNPTYDDNCGNTTVDLALFDAQHPGTTFNWQVSENAAIWYVFRSGAGRSIQANVDELHNPAFTTSKYARRYVRAVGTNCESARTSPMIELEFVKPQPTFTVTPANPKCHGDPTGGFRVDITSPADSWVIYVYIPGQPLAVKEIPTASASNSFSGLAAGTYDVEVQYAGYGKCARRIDGYTLTDPPKLTASLTPSVRSNFNVSCLNARDGTATANVSGGTTPYSFAWTGLPHTGNSIGGQPAGTYTVTVTDANLCTVSESITLTAPTAAPTVSITESGGVNASYRVSCEGVNDGQVTANPVSQVTGAFTYSWNTGQSTQTLSSLGAGTYIVTASDANGCTATATSILYKRPDIDFSFNPQTPIQCKGSPTGGLEVNVASIVNASAPVTYSWSPTNPVETGPSITGKRAGAYTVTVSDVKGCKREKSQSLTDPEGFSVVIDPTSNFNGSRISCNLKEDGALNTIVRDLDNSGAFATPEYYEWFKNAGAYEEGETRSSITGLGEGLYKVVITYKTNCTAEATFDLRDPDPVVPLITIPSVAEHHNFHISCPGKSDARLHVAGSGGTKKPLPDQYSYLWSTGEAGADIINKPAGTYTVTATDANGCTGIADIVVSDPSPVNPVVNIVSNYNGLPVKCRDSSEGKLLASATGGATPINYTWSSGAIGANLDNISPGTYTVSAIDANGCEMTSPPKVVDNPSAVVASVAIVSDFNGQAIRCYNEANGMLRASGTGGTNSFSYLWSTGTAGSDLNDLGAGSYTVTVRDMNGCTDTESATLTNPDPVVVTINSSSSYNGFGVHCNGDADGFVEAIAGGGTESFSYLWAETNDATPKAENLVAGSYTVTATDTNGCTDTETHEVTEPTVLTIALTGFTDITCYGGSDGLISVTAAGGVPADYEFSVDNNTWTSTGSFSLLRADIPYVVVAKDRNGCEAQLTKTLAQPPEIQIDFTTEPAFCADPRGAAFSQVTGGVGTYVYEWKNSADDIIGNGSSITGQTAGVYTLEVRDGSNCPMVEDIGIMSTDGPQVVIDQIVPAKCSYSADGNALLNVTEGDGPFTFLWPDGQTSILGNNLAEGRYFVTVRDVNDCPTVAAVDIPAPDALDIMLANSIVPSCKGFCDGSIEVQSQGGTGPYNFTWATQSGAVATGLCTGAHSVTVTDANACVATESFTIAEPEELRVRLVERVLPLCNGDCNGSLTVEAAGGNGIYNYAWSSGSTTANPTALCANDHTLILTDNKGCTLTRTFALGQPERLQVQLTRNVTPICHDGCDGELAVSAIGGTGAYAYRWNTNASTNELTDRCSGDYQVVVSDDNACSVTGTYTIANPPALIVDLGGSITLCVGQTHTLDAGQNWSTYAWGSNTGLQSTARAVTIGDAGAYWVDVINPDGCTARDTFMLETSTNLLQANLFMASEAMAGDTVVIIDVSWPLPEHISWTYPAEMITVLDLGFAVYGQFTEPGAYDVTLTAQLGQCNDELTKTITILPATEDEPEGGRLGHEKFVKEFTLYPNPTDGDFDVKVELAEESAVTFSVWNTTTSRNVMTLHDSGHALYDKHIDLRPLTSGTYLLRLDHKEGSTSIRFIVH